MRLGCSLGEMMLRFPPSSNALGRKLLCSHRQTSFARSQTKCWPQPCRRSQRSTQPAVLWVGGSQVGWEVACRATEPFEAHCSCELQTQFAHLPIEQEGSLQHTKRASS